MKVKSIKRNLYGAALLTPVAAICLSGTVEVRGQGCIPIRSVGSAALPGTAGLHAEHPWLATLGYRYFLADRYFMGTQELSAMPGMAPGEQVINEIHTLDFAVSYTFRQRLTLTLDLPVSFGRRTSREEHMGMMDFTQPQFTTRADGLGDLRLTGDFWLLNPAEHTRGNVALGLGVKAPTGEYKARDNFRTPAGIVNRPVDQAIQPGDGGWGVIFQVQGFQHIIGHLSMYANGVYLMNPRNVNNVPSFSMKPRDAQGNAFNLDHVNSVTDQYLGRAGLNYGVWPAGGLSLSLGGRIDGVPVRDLVGGDQGFRRPGYTVSIEPGLNWAYGRHLVTVSTPVAVARNRQRSLAERAFAGHPEEMLRMYPASFADWSLSASYSFSF